MQGRHDVAKDARRVGVAENDRGTVQAEEVELSDSTAFSFSPMIFAYFIPASGLAPAAVITRHPGASSLGGTAKGQGVGDFNLAQLRLGQVRTTLTDAERGERDVDSLGVRRNLLLSRSMLTTTSETFESAKTSVLRRYHHHLLAQRVLNQKVHDPSTHISRRAQHDRGVLRVRRCGCHRHLTVVLSAVEWAVRRLTACARSKDLPSK